MPNVLTQKLEIFGALTSEDRRLLDDVVAHPRNVPAKTKIIREGDAPDDVHLVMEGVACRSKLVPSGGRQIFAYLVPGDFCDQNIFILREMDHDIETISACRMVDIPRRRILELADRPAIARAFWWATLVDEATLREWLVNLGQREASQRLAHLFCELHLRFKSVGLATDGAFALPISQLDLADTMGISAVHANRSLQELRSLGLLEFKAGMVVVPDIPRLEEFADFNPNYLHLSEGALTAKREPSR